MPAKRFLEGKPARFFDPDTVAWAKELIPKLKPEPEEAGQPALEVWLLPAEGEKPGMVRPTVARQTVGYRRLGTFVPLGKRILEEKQLQLTGMMTAGVLQYLYGVKAGHRKQFAELCKRHEGCKAALVKNGQVVDTFTLSPKLRPESFARSFL